MKPEETALDAYYNMSEKGAIMIADNVKLAAKGMPRPHIPQDESKARYFSFPTSEEIEALENMTSPHLLYDEHETVERYLKMFSDEEQHSDHASGLGLVIRDAIINYHNGKTLTVNPQFYVPAPEKQSGLDNGPVA